MDLALHEMSPALKEMSLASKEMVHPSNYHFLYFILPTHFESEPIIIGVGAWECGNV